MAANVRPRCCLLSDLRRPHRRATFAYVAVSSPGWLSSFYAEAATDRPLRLRQTREERVIPVRRAVGGKNAALLAPKAVHFGPLIKFRRRGPRTVVVEPTRAARLVRVASVTQNAAPVTAAAPRPRYPLSTNPPLRPLSGVQSGAYGRYRLGRWTCLLVKVPDSKALAVCRQSALRLGRYPAVCGTRRDGRRALIDTCTGVVFAAPAWFADRRPGCADLTGAARGGSSDRENGGRRCRPPSELRKGSASEEHVSRACWRV